MKIILIALSSPRFMLRILSWFVYRISTAKILQKAGDKHYLLGLVPVIGDVKLWCAIHPVPGLVFGLIKAFCLLIIMWLGAINAINGAYYFFYIILWGLHIYEVIRLGYCFRKSTAFTFGLFFLGLFFMPILAFGESKYYGDSDITA